MAKKYPENKLIPLCSSSSLEDSWKKAQKKIFIKKKKNYYFPSLFSLVFLISTLLLFSFHTATTTPYLHLPSSFPSIHQHKKILKIKTFFSLINFNITPFRFWFEIQNLKSTPLNSTLLISILSEIQKLVFVFKLKLVVVWKQREVMMRMNEFSFDFVLVVVVWIILDGWVCCCMNLFNNYLMMKRWIWCLNQYVYVFWLVWIL